MDSFLGFACRVFKVKVISATTQIQLEMNLIYFVVLKAKKVTFKNGQLKALTTTHIKCNLIAASVITSFIFSWQQKYQQKEADISKTHHTLYAANTGSKPQTHIQ